MTQSVAFYRARPDRFLVAALLTAVAMVACLFVAWQGLSPSLDVGPDGRIAHVRDGSAADDLGIEPGDRVISRTTTSSGPFHGDWRTLTVVTTTGTVIVPHDNVDNMAMLPYFLALFLVSLLCRLASREIAWWLLLGALLPACSYLLAYNLFPPVSVLADLILLGVACLYATSHKRLRHSTRISAACLGLAASAAAACILAGVLAPGQRWGHDLSLAAGLSLVGIGWWPQLAPIVHRRHDLPAGLFGDHFVSPASVLVAEELVPDLATARFAAIEAERARIGTEIHNSILPELLRALRALEGPARARTNVDIRARLTSVEVGLRDLVSSARVPLLEAEGLVAALEWLAEYVQNRDGVEVQMHIDAQTGRPPYIIELSAFRMAQNAIENAVRHGRASTVVLRVVSEPEACSVAVSDNGAGMSVADATLARRANRLGLADMENRAQALAAQLHIGPTPEGGTEVSFAWKS